MDTKKPVTAQELAEAMRKLIANSPAKSQNNKAYNLARTIPARVPEYK